MGLQAQSVLGLLAFPLLVIVPLVTLSVWVALTLLYRGHALRRARRRQRRSVPRIDT